MARTKDALMIGPVAIDQSLDPTDPDEAGGIAGPTGAGLDSLKIIQANASQYANLTPILALPRDEERSATLDVEEVEKVSGQEGIEGASVRGSGEDERKRVVVYLWRAESGRSGKHFLLYDDLPKSKKAYEERAKLEEDAARAARSVGGSEATHGEDPRVKTLNKKIADLERGLKRSEDARVKAEAEAESALAEAEAAKAASAEGDQ